MNYFVILHGAHCRDISPDTFDAHKVPEYSTVLCDSFDTSGSLIEFKRGDMKFFIPHDAVAMVVSVPTEKVATGFGIPVGD
jgi:hypothetical protein